MAYFQDPQLEHHLEKAKMVIFDYNGLIVDDEPLQLMAFNQFLSKYGIEISEHFFITECVGNRPEEVFVHIFNTHDVSPEMYDVEDCVNSWREERAAIDIDASELVREGVLDMMNYLSDEKILMAVASSSQKPLIEKALSQLGVDDQISLVISAEDVSKGKPDPEAYLKVKGHFGIEAVDALVFEDSSVGVDAAIGAGMYCFAVPNRFTEHQDFVRATFVIDSLRYDAEII